MLGRSRITRHHGEWIGINHQRILAYNPMFQKACPLGLFAGGTERACGAPSHPASAFLRAFASRMPASRGRGKQAVYIIIGWHDAHDPRRRKRAFRAHAAPPGDRLDAAHDRHAPARPRHLPQPGNRGLDGIVGGRPRPASPPLRLDGGERRAAVRGSARRAPCPAQPSMGTDPFAPRWRAPKKRLPPGAPGGTPCEPCRGRIGTARPEKAVGRAGRPGSRFRPGVQGGAPPDPARRAKRAPSSLGARPRRGGRDQPGRPRPRSPAPKRGPARPRPGGGAPGGAAARETAPAPSPRRRSRVPRAGHRRLPTPAEARPLPFVSAPRMRRPRPSAFRSRLPAALSPGKEPPERGHQEECGRAF